MISDLSMHPVAGGLWLLAWTSAASVFRIYRDSVLIGTTRLHRFQVTIASGEFPVFQVLDDTEGDPAQSYPSRATIVWTSDPEVASYEVQEYIDAVWTTRATIQNTSGKTYYRWTSGVLADATTHQFRVIPTGTNGNAGTAAALSVLMCRVPDPPQLTFWYETFPFEVTIDEA